MRTFFSTAEERKTRRGGFELELAVFAITVLCAVYFTYDLLTEPRGGHPFGHWLGIVGTLFMVMTETLYSIRKRTRLLNWGGPVRDWLSFHIFTGLVGPFLVLMHTGLHFRGLAGFTMLLTFIVVLSGFIGRYLYTGVQRGVRGAEGDYESIALRIQAQRGQLENLRESRALRERRLRTQIDDLFQRWPGPLRRLRQSWWLRGKMSDLDREEKKIEGRLKGFIRRKQQLERAMARADRLRRMFRIWHIVHVPIGITLFVSAGIHIAATLYFRAGIFAP